MDDGNVESVNNEKDSVDAAALYAMLPPDLQLQLYLHSLDEKKRDESSSSNKGDEITSGSLAAPADIITHGNNGGILGNGLVQPDFSMISKAVGEMNAWPPRSTTAEVVITAPGGSRPPWKLEGFDWPSINGSKCNKLGGSLETCGKMLECLRKTKAMDIELMNKELNHGAIRFFEFQPSVKRLTLNFCNAQSLDLVTAVNRLSEAHLGSGFEQLLIVGRQFFNGPGLKNALQIMAYNNQNFKCFDPNGRPIRQTIPAQPFTPGQGNARPLIIDAHRPGDPRIASHFTRFRPVMMSAAPLPGSAANQQSNLDVQKPSVDKEKKESNPENFQRIRAPVPRQIRYFTPMANIEHDYVDFYEETIIPTDEAAVQNKNLPGMLKYGAACSNSKVCRIIFGSKSIRMKMDTKDTITIPAEAETFDGICNTTVATSSLVLVFAGCPVAACTSANWEKFTEGTRYVSFSGHIPKDSLFYILPLLKTVGSLNFNAFQLKAAGGLGELSPRFAPVVEKLFFDVRGTNAPTFIDNVTALFEGYYTASHGQKCCFYEITLIITDFAERFALQTQVERLTLMLKERHSSVVVATTLPGNDNILSDLQTLGFQQTHDGYIEDAEHAMEHYIYWSGYYNSREVVFGFKDHRTEPIAAAVMPIIQ
uniref:Uncharacterized protein n=1 Tax=Panagrolaimus superbus TaxID=310955 RepID=A0A914ZAE3_9BILA